MRVAYVEFYIVPRTGVFTTDTRLNTGLRPQRRPELDGDLERELECPADHMAYVLSVVVVAGFFVSFATATGLYCPQDREANHARTHYRAGLATRPSRQLRSKRRGGRGSWRRTRYVSVL